MESEVVWKLLKVKLARSECRNMSGLMGLKSFLTNLL